MFEPDFTLLFLVRNRLECPAVWQTFRELAAPGQVRSLVHCASPADVTDPFLREHRIAKQVEDTSRFTAGLVLAQLHLLRAALQGGPTGWLHFVSDSTVPLVPPAAVALVPVLPYLPPRTPHKTSQWVSLSPTAARLVLEAFGLFGPAPAFDELPGMTEARCCAAIAARVAAVAPEPQHALDEIFTVGVPGVVHHHAQTRNCTIRTNSVVMFRDGLSAPMVLRLMTDVALDRLLDDADTFGTGTVFARKMTAATTNEAMLCARLRQAAAQDAP